MKKLKKNVNNRLNPADLMSNDQIVKVLCIPPSNLLNLPGWEWEEGKNPPKSMQ